MTTPSPYLTLPIRSEEEARGGKWRPIETQPKTGMYLLANAKGEVCPVQYHYQAHHGVITNCVGVNDWTFGEPATHWMPLPAPPHTEGGREG